MVLNWPSTWLCATCSVPSPIACAVTADKSLTQQQLPGDVRTHSLGWIPDPAARAGSIAVSTPQAAAPAVGGGTGRFRSASDCSLGIVYDAPSSLSVVGDQAARAPSMEDWSDDLAAPSAGEPAPSALPKVSTWRHWQH